MSAPTVDFPLFALPLVVLPGEIVPLHIFEERYQQLVDACLADEREFAVVQLTDDVLQEIGCACVIERVLETFDDGRRNIVVRGTRPLRVLEREHDLPYPTATVEFLNDTDRNPSAAQLEVARGIYAQLVRKATDRAADPAEIAALDAYAMAATVDFGLDVKQTLLSLRSEPARLTLLTRLFRAALRRLDFVDRAQARAKSNGKVSIA
ncbi:MAG: LON peptidase substrate-binding domain-containing protein [Solirubrobacteraceae bacterium]